MKAALRWVVPGLLLFVMALAMPYPRNILLWLDRGVNTALGGDPRETVSSACGKVNQGRSTRRVLEYTTCWWVCPVMDVVDPGHCVKSIDPQVGDDSLFNRLKGKDMRK